MMRIRNSSPRAAVHSGRVHRYDRLGEGSPRDILVILAALGLLAFAAPRWGVSSLNGPERPE
jgi:hypothetical protein